MSVDYIADGSGAPTTSVQSQRDDRTTKRVEHIYDELDIGKGKERNVGIWGWHHLIEVVDVAFVDAC